VLFHLSSGAWGMQSTLMLAACCLPLKKARMFETSKERPVREVQLPVVLFARDARHHLPGRARLTQAARRKLLPDTVVDDPTVEAAYAMLAGAAAQRGAQTLLIQGPTGSGKWHAARQFAHWRKTQAVREWLHPGMPVDEVSGGSTVLIWRLDAWDAGALQALSAWRAAHPDVSVVATWRTDMPAAAAMHEVARAGLRGAVFVTLPALSARTDIVELGKAVARQAGIFDGKVAGRLQYVLGADVYGHNLHDLKQVLVTTSLHSSGQYPDERGWLRAAQIIDAAQGEALLREASDTLANLRFGPGRPGLNLDDTLKLVQSLVVKAALARGLTQAQAGTLLGYTQTGISEIVNRELDLKPWQTPVTSIAAALPLLDPPDATA